MRRTIGSLLPLVLLAACGSQEAVEPVDDGAAAESSAEESAEPVEVTVAVDLVDQTPLNLFFNGSAGYCTSVDIGQLLIDGMDTGKVTKNPPRPTVTLRDAEGSIVGSVMMPRRGGDFSRQTGCQWGVEFEGIEQSDFYEVSIESADEEFSQTGQAIGGTPIELRF